MKRFKEYCKKFFKEESGLETIEYVIILALVAGGILIAYQLTNKANQQMSSAAGKVDEMFDSTGDFGEDAIEFGD